ncbi:MAG: archaellin/type IV pilin N-terminal domain-containing protein [Candidatus Bathyarchaeia archaeon]
MKILKSRKALSPVVASIILIAVTVAVSIAVAAWMGALSFGFMGTEQLTITKLTWNWNSNPAQRTFTLVVNNTGTKDVTITQVMVNYGTSGFSQPSSIPTVLKAGSGIPLTVTYAYTNGTAYDISVVTQSGYKFTDRFIGGQNKT